MSVPLFIIRPLIRYLNIKHFSDQTVVTYLQKIITLLFRHYVPFILRLCISSSLI